MIGTCDSRRKSATNSSTPVSEAPERNPISSERCNTGPSAVGSEKGAQISSRSAPLSATTRMSSRVVLRSGSPAVKKGMSAAAPRARKRSNVSSMRFIFLQRHAQAVGNRVHVFVAAPREVDDDDLFARHLRSELG